MKKRNEILERAADRRRFRVGSPQPTKLKRVPLTAHQKMVARAPKKLPVKPAPKVKPAKPPKPVKVKKVRAPKPMPRPQHERQIDLWLEIRPMPDPTMERCPGSGSEGLPGILVDGPHPHLLLCLECRQSVGVYPPSILPEHNREKQP